MIAPSWRSLVQSWRQGWQHCRCVAISSLNSAGSSASTNAFRLLRTCAHRAGYQAFTCGAGDFQDTKVASAFVDDFACAGEAVVAWLHGADAADILSRVENHF